MHESLPPPLRQWVAAQADSMGLPDPDSYIMLLIRLAKQRQDLARVDERYRQVFRPE